MFNFQYESLNKTFSLRLWDYLFVILGICLSFIFTQQSNESLIYSVLASLATFWLIQSRIIRAASNLRHHHHPDEFVETSNLYQVNRIKLLAVLWQHRYIFVLLAIMQVRIAYLWSLYSFGYRDCFLHNVCTSFRNPYLSFWSEPSSGLYEVNWLQFIAVYLLLFTLQIASSALTASLGLRLGTIRSMKKRFRYALIFLFAWLGLLPILDYLRPCACSPVPYGQTGTLGYMGYSDDDSGFFIMRLIETSILAGTSFLDGGTLTTKALLYPYSLPENCLNDHCHRVNDNFLVLGVYRGTWRYLVGAISSLIIHLLLVINLLRSPAIEAAKRKNS